MRFSIIAFATLFMFAFTSCDQEDECCDCSDVSGIGGISGFDSHSCRSDHEGPPSWSVYRDNATNAGCDCYEE